jgi:hypothetical protein
LEHVHRVTSFGMQAASALGSFDRLPQAIHRAQSAANADSKSRRVTDPRIIVC